MTGHYDQAAKLLAPSIPLVTAAVAQVHATLAVAEALDAMSGAERIRTAVPSHADTMAMVDAEIDKMINAAAPSEWHPYTAGWVAGLGELRRRLHEVDEPDDELAGMECRDPERCGVLRHPTSAGFVPDCVVSP